MGVISHGIYRPFPGESVPEQARPTLRTIRRPEMDEEEEDMGKKLCLECGQRETIARGLCHPCYDKLKVQGELDKKYPRGNKPVPKETSGDPGPDKFNQTIDELAQKAQGPAAESVKPEQNIPENIPDKRPQPELRKTRAHRAGAGDTGQAMINLAKMPGLREALEAKARKELRTLNDQILWELHNIFTRAL